MALCRRSPAGGGGEFVFFEGGEGARARGEGLLCRYFQVFVSLFSSVKQAIFIHFVFWLFCFKTSRLLKHGFSFVGCEHLTHICIDA